MKKADAWVILRFDGDAIRSKDYVAVKGVYSSESAAQSAVPDSSGESSYIVVRSRRYLEEGESETLTNSFSERTQGLEIHPSSGHTDIVGANQQFDALRDFWDQLPQQTRRSAILPLLSYWTEFSVARALGASVVNDPESTWDLELHDGKKVEVKTVLLDTGRKKSPNLQFHAHPEFNFFVIVIFRSDLTIELARMIPVEALQLYARPVHIANRPMLNLRVVQPLLNYPGSKNINLANSLLNTG